MEVSQKADDSIWRKDRDQIRGIVDPVERLLDVYTTAILETVNFSTFAEHTKTPDIITTNLFEVNVYSYF